MARVSRKNSSTKENVRTRDNEAREYYKFLRGHHRYFLAWQTYDEIKYEFCEVACSLCSFNICIDKMLPRVIHDQPF